MTTRANGTFDVKIIAQEDPQLNDPTMSRLTLDKQFHGDLEATSKGQMLAAGNPASGSGGYVAIEKVSGKLQGRSGTFVLQHFGTMDRGKMELNVHVVPGSGTDQLTGLSGKMSIQIDNGKHFYELEYSLAEAS